MKISSVDIGNPAYDRPAKEPEFKIDEFLAVLFDHDDNEYEVIVTYESFIYDGQVRVVSLEISGRITEYTLGDCEDIISSRNRNLSVYLEVTPKFN